MYAGAPKQANAAQRLSVPAYSEWTVPQLQEEADKYSFRKTSNKKQLVKYLEAAWAALHPEQSASDEAGPSLNPVSSPVKRKKSGRAKEQKAAPGEEVIEISSSDEVTTPRKGQSIKGKGKRKALLDDDSDDDIPLILSSPGTSSEMERLTGKMKLTGTGELSGSQEETQKIPRRRGRPPGSKSTKVKEKHGRAAKKAQGKGKGAKQTRRVADSENSFDDATDDSGKEGEDGEEEEEEEDEQVAFPSLTAATSIQLKRAIRADKQLWRRILLMEPISLDEFVSIANRPARHDGGASTGLSGAGLAVKTAKQRAELRTWLEMQGICTYADELTGSRRRH